MLASSSPIRTPIPRISTRYIGVVRRSLRETTAAIHARLHQHDDFEALQDGKITRKDYGGMLRRLYGFDLPYEAASAAPLERSGWLRHDLARLADPDHASPTVLLCDYLPRLDNAERHLGALYVVEGPTPGGRSPARHLDHICGVGVPNGRRFFHGRGGSTGAAWSGSLNRISEYNADTATHGVIVDAALETFACFERWVAGWRVVSNV